MLFVKHLGIAIGIMIVLSLIIWILNKTAKDGYANYSPYQYLDYVNHPNALNSQMPISRR